MSRLLIPACGVLATLVLSAGMASAAVTTYTAILSGDNEVPPVTTPAVGIATLILDDSGGFGASIPLYLEFSGLTGTQNAVHIHQAPVGSNGPAILGLPLGSPVDIEVLLSQLPIASLAAGELYINVHTTTFPSGEIRGQFLREGTVDVVSARWGAIKALYR
jgi:hypothetical protein